MCNFLNSDLRTPMSYVNSRHSDIYDIFIHLGIKMKLKLSINLDIETQE